VLRSPLALADDGAAATTPSPYPAPPDEPQQGMVSGGLIARVRELAHLDHILWKARRGTGSAVVLRGEPGVGKSSLIEAAVVRANDFSVLQLRGTSVGGHAAAPREWPAPLADLLARDDVGSEIDAAVQAIEKDCDLQVIEYGSLREWLLKDKQILAWPAR